MRHFLLIFDTTAQTVISQLEFAEADTAQATAAYEAAEEAHRNDPVEIVLLGADSLETIRRTHGHYFNESDIDRYLQAI